MSRRTDAGIYYYSKYELTTCRKLQRKHPDVCTAADLERIFEPGRAVNLYGDVVLKATEWPTKDHSVKTLARHLGFSWRDAHPLGAESIEWFDRWCRERPPRSDGVSCSAMRMTVGPHRCCWMRSGRLRRRMAEQPFELTSFGHILVSMATRAVWMERLSVSDSAARRHDRGFPRFRRWSAKDSPIRLL